MPDPREITDVAIDSAIHKLKEPKNGWRNYIPPEDLGAMVSAGSGQITLQALVALLWYGDSDERRYAIRALNNYSDICWVRFMLSEPWSAIYGSAIVSCWVSVVLIATTIGETQLANRFRDLIEAWSATCRLMEAKVGGKVLVMAAGCRCWGHDETISSMSGLWRYASGRTDPPVPGSSRYGVPGSYDNWGWQDRASRLGISIYRSVANLYPENMPIDQLVSTMPHWAARTEMQLLGWKDGSRLWIMGDDEVSLDDEDENSNTPGWLLAGVLGGRIVALPDWPNPIDGVERLRQVNCRADVDGSPERGWSLWHNYLGAARGKHTETGESGFISVLPPYTKSNLIFHYLIPEGNKNWVRLLGSPIPVPTPDPTPNPSPDPTPNPPQPSGSLQARVGALDNNRYLLTVKPSSGKTAIVRKIHPDENRPGEDRYVIEETGG